MQHNLSPVVSPILPTLDALRGQIDAIDDAILDLIEQRYAVTRFVARAKADAGSKSLPIRPQRERAILERLSARATHVPSSDIAHIWQTILSLSARSQKAYRLILWSPENTRTALAGLATVRFGTAIPILWAASAEEAIDAAQSGDAILLMPADLLQPSQVPDLDLIGQYPLDCLLHPWAAAMGKLAEEPAVAAFGSGDARRTEWHPASWRTRVHHQLPAYGDVGALEMVEARLRRVAPVVEAREIDALAAELVEAQNGYQLLIQAGDCAEPINGTRRDTTHMSALVHKMADELEVCGRPVIRIGRLAGQFAKPRSASTEQADGAALAVYRGDAVNGPGASAVERAADPERLHEAYAQSCRVTAWLAEQSLASGGPRRPMFTSHEALLLNYEAALTRRDHDGCWRALSAHSLWLGDRTRDPRGAHVEFLRGIANPVGIKCGPSIEPDQLLALLDRIDPERTPGRVMLVTRLGHEKIASRLGPLMAAVRGAGHPVLWLCDPMHGNNRTIVGLKTRLVPDIVSEVRQFAAIARSLGVPPGGLHLEVTPATVMECVDDLSQAYAPRRFESRCDPRLNADQAMHVVRSFADAIERVR